MVVENGSAAVELRVQNIMAVKVKACTQQINDDKVLNGNSCKCKPKKKKKKKTKTNCQTAGL